MQILHSPSKDSPFIVVSKDAHVPSAPLFEGDESLLTVMGEKYPEILRVSGRKKIEYGLIHRIDTETQGLVLIATSQESYDTLVRCQKEGRFRKWYRARIDKVEDCATVLGGFPNLGEEAKNSVSQQKNPVILESIFRPYGKNGREVRPVTSDSGRAAIKKSGNVLYKTEIVFEGEESAVCSITAGYRHQVRCHLAWCGRPVQGDVIYNPTVRNRAIGEKTEMKFAAFRIDFPHPISGELLSFSLPDSQT